MTYKIEYTKFDITKLVEVESINDATDLDYDDVLWVERNEDYYALMSPEYKNKKILIVKKSVWDHTETFE